MKWILIIILLIVIFLIIIRRGNITFWKLVKKHPFQAYEFFINNDCWFVIYPNDLDIKPSDGEWTGPFFVIMPQIGRLKIYGKVGEFEKKQEEFVELFK